MDFTRPRPSQKNCTLFLLNNLPYTEQLKMIGTNSLAIMVIVSTQVARGTGTIDHQIVHHSPMCQRYLSISDDQKKFLESGTEN